MTLASVAISGRIRAALWALVALVGLVGSASASYIGSWKIDDLVVFACNTHRFDTGAATDGDSAPTYRVYEDETGTAILTGSMALLDDANTVGYYSEQLTLSAANGFEKGKTYTIRISGTVNSVTGATWRTFQIEAEVDSNQVSDPVTIEDGTGAGQLDTASGVVLAKDHAGANLATASALDAVDNFVDTEVADILTDTGTTLDDLVDDLESRVGTPSDLGSGATVAFNLSDIEAQTDDIGAAGAGLTAADDAVMTRLGAPAGASVSADIAEVEGQTDDIGAAGAGLTALATQASVNTIDDFLDTEIAALIATLTGIVPTQGTIGATGNDTTHLHLAGLAYADDAINSMLLTIKDVSTGLLYSRWIEDFANTGDLVTVGTLPFTPEASVDLYWLTPVRADVTGGSGLDAAGVRAAIGLASANLDTQLSGIQSDTNLYDTDAEHATAILNAATATYGSAGSYGLLFETQLDAAMSSRASQASLDTVDDYVDAEVAAIKAKTDNLPADPADDSDIDAQLAALQADSDLYDTDGELATATWNAATATYGSAGSYGLLVEANLDATVSTRATPVQVATELATYDGPTHAETQTACASPTEVATEMAAIRLDELLAADSDIDGAQPPTVGSVIHESMTKTAGSFTYDQATDSQEAIRDRGDAVWLTATGFSTHSAADVWTSGTRTLTAATNITSTGGTTVPQTGDSFARLGAPAGASVSADVLVLDNFVDDLETRIPDADVDTYATRGLGMIELDGAVYRYTTNSLEQAPGGAGSNPNVLLDTTVLSLTSQTLFRLTAGADTVTQSLDDQAIVLYDASDGNEPSVRKVTNYAAATREITIDSAPGFTLEASDGVKVFVTAPGTTAPTAAEIWTYQPCGGSVEAGEKVCLIGTGLATITTPVASNGSATVKKGDAYSIAEGNHLTWTVEGLPDLVGHTLKTTCVKTGTTTPATLPTRTALVVSGSSEPKVLQVELTAVETAAMALGTHACDVRSTDLDITLLSYTLTVSNIVTP